ncbi:MAG: glycosyltransferase [Acidobacteria bacterium]|nr:glycosyltransferase [Acidobacteriota bacterium]
MGHALRRRRIEASYRAALAEDRFVVEAGPRADAVAFSVVMPVYRVAEPHLRAAIDAVRAQSHGAWELLLVDDASPDPHVSRVLAQAGRSDPRIRAWRRATNGGIAVASNEGIAAARGEFVAFVDHDDLLHRRALELAARVLAAERDVDWLFTDEDKIDESGRHSEPCFKPGFSRHLLLSFNYVTHLRVVRRTLLDRLGGHRLGFDGAQDYDLALRAAAAGARFAHLPGVLYHWRTVGTSMALAAATKPAAHDNALRSLAEHASGFPHGGAVTAEVLLQPASFFKVRRACPRDLHVAVVDTAGDGAPWTAELGWPVTLLRAGQGHGLAEHAERARTAAATFLIVPPPGGLSRADVDELLALLQVPGCAVAAGRALKGGRVAASGLVVTPLGPWDPWAGQAANDPGYLNLAAVPMPRLVPPLLGWAARCEALAGAMAAAADVPPAWRLTVGLFRLRLEAVSTPTVSFPAPALGGEVPEGPPPTELPTTRVEWLRYAGVRPDAGLKRGPSR